MVVHSNNRIAYNSILLYIRLIIVSICGLITTRYALQALGVIDFGLFSVAGSVIAFIAIFNTIMISTSNRFIATAIGKNDLVLINEIFNVNVIIHILIAIITFSIAIPIGKWYIINYINFDGNIDIAIKVYNYSVIGSIIAFIGVPYNGLLMAKENFIVFCLSDIVLSVLKVIMAYSLVFFFESKLTIYALFMALLTSMPTIIYILYCSKRYKEITKIKIVYNKYRYREVLNFSFWIGFGAVAYTGKNQGSALIVNFFFNTIMNTALGIANSINTILQLFANNINKSITPQIIKSYASGNIKRTEDLVIASSKYTFLLMLFISSPLIIEPEYILNKWLGTVPKYVVTFTYLLIIDALINSLNAGIPDLVFATGKVKWYQIIVNSLYLLSIVIAYLILKNGAEVFYLLYTYIFFSSLIFFIRQFILNKLINFDNWLLIKKSYLPCFIVTILYLPIALFNFNLLHPILVICLSSSILMILIFIVGLDKTERIFIVKKISTFWQLINIIK